MYLPPLFKVEDRERLFDAMEEIALCTLVTLNGGGLIASHLPMVIDRAAGELGVLRGHLSRANQQTTELSAEVEALAIFLGPQAYVSPAWYPSKQEHGKVVPTWNYVAVHAYGRLEVHADPARILANVTALTDRHERGRAEPWQVSDAPAAHVEAQLKGILGVDLTISRLEGKWKLSQNRPPADADAVEAGLAASDAAGDRAVAAAMAALPPRR